MARRLIPLAALLLLSGVAAGAFGAHGLKSRVNSDMLAIWQTASLFQLIHGLGILLLVALEQSASAKWLRRAAYTMFSGVILFSGSLYVLVLTGVHWLGAVTPVGGSLFIAAWALLAIAAWSGKE